MDRIWQAYILNFVYSEQFLPRIMNFDLSIVLYIAPVSSVCSAPP